MQTLNRASLIRRELIAAQRIPYSAQVAPSLVKTVAGDYVQVFRLSGASFESADDEQLNSWHERLNVLWRNIASAHISLWAHVIRRRETTAAGGRHGAGFADGLNERYRQRLIGETLMVNEWYLATVYRPTSGAATRLVSRLLAKSQHNSS